MLPGWSLEWKGGVGGQESIPGLGRDHVRVGILENIAARGRMAAGEGKTGDIREMALLTPLSQESEPQ